MLARLAAIAVLALVATGAAGGQPPTAHPCRAALPHGPSVPAAVILWNGCGTFRLGRDGRVARLPRYWLARHGSGTGRRYGADLNLHRARTGSYTLLRHGRVVWRSHGLYPNDGGDVAFGPGFFAFRSYDRGIYLTDLRSPEELVVPGRGVYPVDFTHDGELIVAAHGMLLVVSRNGATRRYRYSRGFAFDGKTDTLYFVTPNGVLAAARHERVRRFGRAPAFNEAFSLAEPSLLVWQRAHSLRITRRDGSFVASGRWPASLGGIDTWVTISADGELFAYRVSDAQPGGGKATANVFLIRRGEHHARLILRDRLRLASCCCGVGGALSWHGRFLLYASGADRLEVLDTRRRGANTDLTRLASRLPKLANTEIARAAWASDFQR
jgi:hypothetical protein